MQGALHSQKKELCAWTIYPFSNLIHSTIFFFTEIGIPVSSNVLATFDYQLPMKHVSTTILQPWIRTKLPNVFLLQNIKGVVPQLNINLLSLYFCAGAPSEASMALCHFYKKNSAPCSAFFTRQTDKHLRET